MKKYKKIVFVGNDNTCRSVMAETIFRSMAVDMEYEILSRGIVVLFPEPHNKKVEMVLYSHGLHAKVKNSVSLDKADLEEDALILTVSLADKVKLMETFDHWEDVFTIKEFLNEDGEIPNPYGEDVDVYEACFDEMQELMKKVADRLRLQS
jgi:protein-tyrosine-phosphatase